MPGYVSIISNKPQGTLYDGVMSDLQRRVYEHREEKVEVSPAAMGFIFSSITKLSTTSEPRSSGKRT